MKPRALLSLSHPRPIAREIEQALNRLDEERIVERIWNKDHTVWRPQPRELVDRLGWLDLVAAPPAADAELDALVDEVRRSELRDVVLLGMGGSSLGAEALRTSFGEREGYPRLHVLDSTHPRWVRRIRRAIDPATTLFLVASKSGTTAEVMAFYRYFRSETESAVAADAGRHFVAITDPGTPLAALAAEAGFLRTLVNPPDIGGRFSVLSRFGLVAAALSGIDPLKLLRRAHAMAERCRPAQPAVENPGAGLGAVLGAAALAGRDQLILLTPKKIASFGLWVEQLIAESTGKDGTGILPVTGEPPVPPGLYRQNRLFVALRYTPEPEPELDARIAGLRDVDQPVIVFDLEDLHDLGAEFFRWEFATAVAGHLLGIHPFDQPDVQASKAETRRRLDAFEATGELPGVGSVSSLAEQVGARPAPRYVALMAYVDAGDELEQAIAKLRLRLRTEHGLDSTFGYGPRFLHSTGQLHKGGPDGGLFVQLVAETAADPPIPGERYGFGLLLKAQAAGDLAALEAKGRKCVRIDLGDDPTAGIHRLINELRGVARARLG